MAAAAAAAGAGGKKPDGMDDHGSVSKKAHRRRGRPTKAMVAQRERQQAQAAADRVLGALDVIEGNMGGVRAFVDCVTASVITVRAVARRSCCRWRVLTVTATDWLLVPTGFVQEGRACRAG